MQYDATLKKLFRRPPNRLLTYALGSPVVIQRALPTEQIVIEKVHPDLLLETGDGRILHVELQGYPDAKFACRNLIYYGLVLRDYDRPPKQIVFWVGDKNVGVKDGLRHEPELNYHYRVIDVRKMDPAFLLESEEPSEWVFSILCKLANPARSIALILRKLADLPLKERREAVVQLLILSGLRGLKTVVETEVKRMPISIDIHENEFLEDIFQQGQQKGREQGLQQGQQQGRLDQARQVLLKLLAARCGDIPADIVERIAGASLPSIDGWTDRLLAGSSLPDIFA